jgi:hypothetical protein
MENIDFFIFFVLNRILKKNLNILLFKLLNLE